MYIIRLANQRVESQPQPPGQCPRCGSRGLHKWGRPRVRRVVDISVSEIRTQRYRCKNCRKTMTAKPVGVGRASRSHAFTALVCVLYALGLSQRGIETAMALFGKRTLGRAKGRLSKETRLRHKALLDQLSEMVADLPSDGARRLLEWSTGGRLPDELRWLVTHLLVKWRELTLHQRRSGAPNSTNWLEGRFPGYRTTRGLKSDAGALNFMSVVCDVLA